MFLVHKQPTLWGGRAWCIAHMQQYMYRCLKTKIGICGVIIICKKWLNDLFELIIFFGAFWTLKSNSCACKLDCTCKLLPRVIYIIHCCFIRFKLFQVKTVNLMYLCTGEIYCQYLWCDVHILHPLVIGGPRCALCWCGSAAINNLLH